MHRTTVVAALIRKDGRILIGRRRSDQLHALKWEFPGGKLEPGEEPQVGLARELMEELSVDARIGEEVERYEYCYPGGRPLLLIFYEVDSFAGELRNCVFEEIRWVEASTLPEFDFLEGDVQFVRRLSGSRGAGG
jgi:8-oxo-dGTP diphosphatase